MYSNDFMSSVVDPKTIFGDNQPIVFYKEKGKAEPTFIVQSDRKVYRLGEKPAGFVFAPFGGGVDEAIIVPRDKRASVNFMEPPQLREGTLSSIPDESAQHTRLVAKAVEKIRSGAFEKVVLSRKITINYQLDSMMNLLQRMIERYPNAFCYVFYHPEIGMWAGATPELLLNYNDSVVTTMALAGTQPLMGYTHPKWGDKERAEQQVVVDVIKQKLALYSNNVSASPTYTKAAGSVCHLCTDMNAFVGKEVDVWEIVKALHPTPAVCGYPTEKAREFILANEGYDRQYYTGFCGLVEENKLDLYVNLRCMQLKEGKAHLYVGGGITKDSNPESEFAETQHKAQTMLAVL